MNKTTVERKKGKQTSLVTTLISLALGSTCALAGAWLPVLGEKYAYLQDQGEVVSEVAGTKLSVRSLSPYPLLRLVSRVVYGPQFYTRRLALVKNLPELIDHLQKSEFEKADTYLITLFEQGLFEEILLENDRFLYDFQKTLGDLQELKKKEISLRNRRAGFIDETEELKERMASNLDRFRNYLGLRMEGISAFEKTYDSGPLRGIPLQPEISEEENNLPSLARRIDAARIDGQQGTTTDEFVTTSLAEWRQVFRSLRTTIRNNEKGSKKLTAELQAMEEKLESETYLITKKVAEMVSTYSSPPELLAEDILIPQSSA